MSNLTSLQRKFVYTAGIIALVLPIVWLGIPAGEEGSGGQLAKLRQQYDLGESTLGDVDPSSASMNLVLLGLRGVAANLLWGQLEEQKKMKNWPAMRNTTESIIRLQPHFIEVWQYHSWNLAYNVSAEWDDVADRYYWVKEGAKFAMRGTERNAKEPELYWDTGKVIGHKITFADEKRFYREFFLSDPNTERFGGGPDPEINPAGQDNNLVAKNWYERANDAELNRKQSIMDRTIFRSYPARAQFDYAASLQDDGVFGEIGRQAWDDAYREWTEKYGQETFPVECGEIRMEMTPEEIEAIAETPEEEERLKWCVNQYQNMIHYRYWRTRSLAERDPNTVAAHREFYQAGEEYKASHLERARQLVESGMQKYEIMLENYPGLVDEDATIEEGLLAVLLWQSIYRLNAEMPPEDFPLKDLWLKHQNRIPMLELQFQRRYMP